ncbi:MAG: hypothetical protein LBC84_07865 [Prevotellaceae bacterium]|nr:hypothetical protein [Prevotellaceae bacterium]
MTKKEKPLWRKIVKIFLLGFVVLLLLITSSAAILLTPKRITPIAQRIVSNLLIADVRFDTLKVSLFQEFPYVNLTLTNGMIRSRLFDSLSPNEREVLPLGCDSLLLFEEAALSLHLTKLFQSQIDIRRIRLRNAQVRAYISPLGIANWDIVQQDTSLVPQSEADAFQLNLQRLIVREGFCLSFRSDLDSLSASLQFDRLFARGNITISPEDLMLEVFAMNNIKVEAMDEGNEMSFASLIDSLRITGLLQERYNLFVQSRNSVIINNEVFAQELPVTIQGDLGFSPSRLDSLFFKDFTISADTIPLLLDGSVVFADPQPRAKLECRLPHLSFSRLITLLPASLLPQAKDIDTDIAAKISVSIDWPAYKVDVSTSGGYLSYPPENASIHTFALDASYTHRPDKPWLSGIDFRQCDVEASGILLHAKGIIRDPSGDPNIDINIQGNIQLDTLYRLFSLPKDVVARGALVVDASAKFLLSNLLRGDINASSLRGRVDAERLMLRIPKDTLFLMARGAHLSLGSNQNQRDTIIEQGTQIVRLSFRADSANVRYKQQFRLTLGGARLSARSTAGAFDGDTTIIHPLNGALEARHLSFQTADSMRIKLDSGAVNFSLMPATHDPSIPVVATQLMAQFFQMNDLENQYQLVSPRIALRATHLQQARFNRPATPRYPQQSDSVRTRQQRVSTREADDFASENIDFEMDEETKGLLRKWQFDGTVEAAGGALSTPYFPLPVSLEDTDIEFNSQEFRLMQTKIMAGRSQIEVTGKISNIRQVLLGRGSLGVSGFIRTDTLDLNELIFAANAGSIYASTGEVVKELEDAGSLMIIPSNLNLDLKLFSEHVNYANEHLTDLSGSLTSRSRTLQINDLEASSSIGDFKMSALYATRSRSDITAGFDLEMKAVQVDRLIALLPSIDTLAPMLRSFEGVVNCSISATTALDTEMNILLPTLKAACRIQGSNMVLLDGETFTEISRMLQFKNKSRNLIDQIAVDLLIRDNRIEVFPFIIEMDRYRAAVSGIHQLDMSFNYHISVLRSPIPFKIGVNVTGTLDNLHYGVGRCRYRDTNIPSYVELIDATRIDLLKAIKAFDPAAAFGTLDRSVARAFE